MRQLNILLKIHVLVWTSKYAFLYPTCSSPTMVTKASYHVALLRLRGAVHGDAIGWRRQLWRVEIDEATSVNETIRREEQAMIGDWF